MSGHSTTGNSVSISMANPSAIGLMGLAMVTLVASSQKLGITTGTSFIIPWVFFLGAIAQIYAGAVDAKLGNTFGATAFFGYGLFWCGVGTSWLIQNGVLGEVMMATADVNQLGFAFLGYLIFSLGMTFASMETNKTLFIIFCLIDVLFIGLAASTFGFHAHTFHMIAAVAELVIALLSFYACIANVVNATFGRTFMPLGKPFGIFKK